MQCVLLVAHDAHRVSLVRREGDEWIQTEHRDGEQVQLEHPALCLLVRDIYRPLAAASHG